MSVESVCLLSLDYRGVYCRGIFCSSFSFRILFYSSTSEIFSNATETNKEKLHNFFSGGNFSLSTTPVWRRLWQPVLGGECTLEFSGAPAADSHRRRYTPYIHFGDLHTSTRFAHGVRSYLNAVLLDSRRS